MSALKPPRDESSEGFSRFLPDDTPMYPPASAPNPLQELEDRATKLYERIEELHKRKVRLEDETNEVWKEIARIHESQFYYQLAHPGAFAHPGARS